MAGQGGPLRQFPPPLPVDPWAALLASLRHLPARAVLGTGWIATVWAQRLDVPYRFFQFFSEAQASRDSLTVHAIRSRQLLHGEEDSIEFVLYHALPRVQRLCSRISPAHVARLIGTRGVDSVERVVSRWCAAYVGKKRREVIVPALTHHDAFGAVILERCVRGVVATRLRVFPRAILFCALTSSRFAVRGKANRGEIGQQTSAALRYACFQCAWLDIAFDAAVASAPPIYLSRTGWRAC